MGEKEENGSSSKGEKLNFPTYPIDVALDVAKKVDEHGGEISSVKTLSEIVGLKGGAFTNRVIAAKRYGILEGTKGVKITELGTKLLHPLNEAEEKKLTIETVLGVPLFQKIYSQYGAELPPKKVISSILLREYHVPSKSIRTAIRVLKQNLKAVPELSNAKGVIKESISELESFTQNEPFSQREMRTETGIERFVVNIVSPVDKHSIDVQEEEDWATIEAIISALKKKWQKRQEANTGDKGQDN